MAVGGRKSYTPVISAFAQSTTITSTFAKSFNSSIIQTTKRSVAIETSTSVTEVGAPRCPTEILSAEPSPSNKASTVTLTTGVLVVIIVGPFILIAICIGVFLFIRKRDSVKNNEATSLNSANYTPPNGPTRADQTRLMGIKRSGLESSTMGISDPKSTRMRWMLSQL
ncbi:uncharacterized protein RAG0_10932 [Rhynchosporium agropyri]|uniref:Mid2 domain-containing protein n=1 Tax=Rhynchosporium agropyri TaxID=914238 RepID=A0A1E1L216_9HELO|nr:uncharacterized protein RAG0_10932 [Rhynchosporium agropyri]